MTVLINRKSPFFDKEGARILYEENKEQLNANYSFDDASNNDFFFNIYEDGELVGCIYALMDKVGDNEYPFYSGFAKRKRYKSAINAIHLILDELFKHYNKVYTYTPHRHVKILNLRAGMKQLKENNNLFYMEK